MLGACAPSRILSRCHSANRVSMSAAPLGVPFLARSIYLANTALFLGASSAHISSYAVRIVSISPAISSANCLLYIRVPRLGLPSASNLESSDNSARIALRWVISTALPSRKRKRKIIAPSLFVVRFKIVISILAFLRFPNSSEYLRKALQKAFPLLHPSRFVQAAAELALFALPLARLGLVRPPLGQIGCTKSLHTLLRHDTQPLPSLFLHSLQKRVRVLCFGSLFCLACSKKAAGAVHQSPNFGGEPLPRKNGFPPQPILRCCCYWFGMSFVAWRCKSTIFFLRVQIFRGKNAILHHICPTFLQFYEIYLHFLSIFAALYPLYLLAFSILSRCTAFALSIICHNDEIRWIHSLASPLSRLQNHRR